MAITEDDVIQLPRKGGHTTARLTRIRSPIFLGSNLKSIRFCIY